MALSGTPSPADLPPIRARSVGLFFTDPESFRTIDLYRVLCAGTAIAAFVLTEAGRSIYRPFIYETGINDLGIADSMGNLGGIIVQVFVSLAILNSPSRKAYRVIAFLVVGYIFYETIQPYLPKGVFDWNDIYGTVIGGLISAATLLLMRSLIKTNRTLARL